MPSHPHGHKTETDPAYPRLVRKVGADLRELRMSQGHSIENVTRIMGQTSGTAISQVERGERSGMSLYIIFKIARALGYDVEIHFVRKGRTKKERQQDAHTPGESSDELPGGDTDRNVVQLRSRSHPSGHARHRGVH